MDLDVLIPLGVCVVMPVLIVWLTVRARQNETNRKAEVMIKAIESGAEIDPNYFKPAKSKTVKEKLLARFSGACITGLIGVAMLVGGILASNATSWELSESPTPLIVANGALLLAIGVALLVSYFLGKKMMAKEIAAEEAELKNKQ